MPVTPHSNTAQSIVRYIAKRRLNSFSVGVLNDAPATRHVLDEEDEVASTVISRSSSLLGIVHKFARGSSSNLTAGASKVVPAGSTCSAASILSAAAAAIQIVEEEDGKGEEQHCDVEDGVRRFSVVRGMDES
jgi:hypothetical protein